MATSQGYSDGLRTPAWWRAFTAFLRPAAINLHRIYAGIPILHALPRWLWKSCVNASADIMLRIICAFETYDEGVCALTRIIERGLPRHDVHLQPEPEFYAKPSARPAAGRADGQARASIIDSCALWLADNLGMRTPPGEPGTYNDAVRFGATVIVVHVSNEKEALHAASLMRSFGAFGTEIASSQWQCAKAG